MLPFLRRRSEPALLYALHCGNLYGTERMALATLEGLSEYGDRVVLAPAARQGDSVAGAAARAGLSSETVESHWQFVRTLVKWLVRHRAVDVIATGVKQSVLSHVLAKVFFVRLRQLHVIHGGTNEDHAYGRKRHLNRLPVRVVAVSPFVRDKLVAHGVRADSISVIDNFLATANDAAPPVRPPYRERPVDAGRVRVAVVSRVDAIKRVDLLVEAVERHGLRAFEFDVFGSGSEIDVLRARAAALPNVRLHGFVRDVPDRLPQADFLLHLCPEEPFGLVLLEAFRGRVVAIAPDRGGAGTVIDPGATGLRFGANDVEDLARTLEHARGLPAAALDGIADAATRALATRFSAQEGARRYRQALALL